MGVLKFFELFNHEQRLLIIAAANRMLALGVTPKDIVEANETLSRMSLENDLKSKEELKKLSQQYCPICGDKVMLQRVNVSKCTNIGGSWTHIEICINQVNCTYTNLLEMK